ncbi:MAG: ion transporter [Promicromonosporaceae bacterium]|nr:ion transporter [Promicromonosporaceae bacterium]
MAAFPFSAGRGKLDDLVAEFHVMSLPTAIQGVRPAHAVGIKQISTEKSRLDRWEQQFGSAMTVGGFIFLIAYAIPILLDGLHPQVKLFCDIVIWVFWAAFAIDFAMRIYLADNKKQFLKHNLVDLVTLGVPMLRPLRALTVVERFSEWAGRNLRGKWLAYVITGSIMLILVGSLAVLDVERGAPGAIIRTWGAALLWAFEAVTAVGFGEYEVVTTEGHIIGMVLMIAGLVLIGFIIATIASWFSENLVEQSHDIEAPAMIGQVARIMEQNDLILAALGKTDTAPENKGSAVWAREETEQKPDGDKFVSDYDDAAPDPVL